VSKDPKKCGGCSLWQANATVQMYAERSQPAPRCAFSTPASNQSCLHFAVHDKAPQFHLFHRFLNDFPPPPISRYTIAGLVSSWRPPPPADDAPAAFATETWKVAEITLGESTHAVFLHRLEFIIYALICRAVDGGSFEVGAHQDCELHTLATVERS
jgi:hypothetical protein